MTQPEHQGTADHGTVDHGAVDLDHADDPHASPADRALDVRLARLVSDRLAGLELPPSRVDLDAVRRRAATARARRRQRTAWMVAAAAAVAVVVAAVGAGLLPQPGTGDRSPATSTAPGSGAVPLRADLPDLPADEVARLGALRPPGPGLAAQSLQPLQPLHSTTTVDCDSAEMDLGVRPAVLDGLDASGMRQECALLDASRIEPDRWLYRFYLPPGVELGDLDAAGATAAGISWTQVRLDQAAQAITSLDRPDEPSGGLTTVRWGARDPALASVRRTGPTSTEITWVEPHGRWGVTGSADVVVRAVVAAEPVRAVRAAIGFVNQGGIEVLRSDDGTLLLVPSTDPRSAMQALGGGRLTRTPEGCLGVSAGTGGFQLVVWPYGTTWDPAAQSLDVPGEGEVRLGQDVRLSGGEGDGLAPLRLVPDACATEQTWIAASHLS